jgi:hypothetical protein
VDEERAHAKHLDWSGKRTRCTSVLSDDGGTFTAHHERSSDGVTWEPSMEVVPRRVD